MPIAYIKQIEAALEKEFDQEIVRNQYAWWLLEKITNTSKADLILKNAVLDQAQEQQLQTWLHEITVLHKPIAYILGTVPFGPLSIIVAPPVLIPRPETEEWALALIAKIQTCTKEPLAILDLCTGSGCIALLCAYLLPHATVYAIDICDDALKLANQNKKVLGIDNVIFIQSDLFEHLDGMQFDLIVSNPPYITADEYAQLAPSVTQWEHTHALMAENAGLAIIEKIIEQAPAHIRANVHLQKQDIKQLYIEIGWQQGAPVKNLMQKKGYTAITIEKDSANKDRVVCGRIANVATAAHT